MTKKEFAHEVAHYCKVIGELLDDNNIKMAREMLEALAEGARKELIDES